MIAYCASCALYPVSHGRNHASRHLEASPAALLARRANSLATEGQVIHRTIWMFAAGCAALTANIVPMQAATAQNEGADASPAILAHTFVSYRDIDLSSATGKVELDRRIKAASRRLCSKVWPHAVAPLIWSCRDRAIADSHAQVTAAIDQPTANQSASNTAGIQVIIR